MYSKKIQRLVLGAGTAAAIPAVSTGVAATASAEPIGPDGPSSARLLYANRESGR